MLASVRQNVDKLKAIHKKKLGGVWLSTKLDLYTIQNILVHNYWFKDLSVGFRVKRMKIKAENIDQLKSYFNYPQNLSTYPHP